MTTQTCPRCGREVLPTAGRGRPRLWCSDECRRLSSEERRAARRTDRPVEIREEIRERIVERSRPLSLDGAIERVLSESSSTKKLLRLLAHRMRRDPPITRAQQGQHAALGELAADLLAAYREIRPDPPPRDRAQIVPDPAPTVPRDRVAEHREAVALVLGSPRSTREVLLGLAEQARQGKLSGAEHSSTVTAVESLFGALLGAGVIQRRR